LVLTSALACAIDASVVNAVLSSQLDDLNRD
jgi:hypothetical protein